MKTKVTIGQVIKAILIIATIAFVVTWIVLASVHNVSPVEELKTWAVTLKLVKDSTSVG